MVELKLVWWPQFPTEEFEYHYLPLTATVGTPRFEYEEAPYFQRLLLHANAAQVTRKKAVISCLAAAMVHGIPVLNLERSTRVELNLPGKARPPSGYPEIFHYRNAYLPESDITVVRGYRVTTVERTFVDICAVNGELEGLVFLESALRRGYTKSRFQQYLDSNCGRWGISKAQKILAKALYGIDSVYETFARCLIEEYFPHLTVEPQVVFSTPNSYYRVDLLIAGFLILEIDGWEKYRGSDKQVRAIYERQIVREQFLSDAGYHVLRVHPDEIASKLLRKIAFLTGHPTLNRHRVLDLHNQPPWWNK